MSPSFVAILALAVTACERDAASDLSRKPLCEGCTIDLPSGNARVPLLVVLHGDRETAADAARRWTAARERGWGVLALQCPRARGCDDEGRWYRWRGPPAWVLDQIDAVDRADRGRVALAGWSGGASYLGMMAPHWRREARAIVFHGGGQPPRADDRCPQVPAYFLVGDRNPAHPAARRLRDYWERCEREARWDLIDGADHAAEDRALDAAKAHAILAWIEERQAADGETFAAR